MSIDATPYMVSRGRLNLYLNRAVKAIINCPAKMVNLIGLAISGSGNVTPGDTCGGGKHYR